MNKLNCITHLLTIALAISGLSCTPQTQAMENTPLCIAGITLSSITCSLTLICWTIAICKARHTLQHGTPTDATDQLLMADYQTSGTKQALAIDKTMGKNGNFGHAYAAICTVVIAGIGVMFSSVFC